MHRLLTTAALAALAAGVAQNANATEGWYGRVDGGYSIDGEVDFDTGASFDLDDNWMADIGVGYAFQNGFRLDGEYSYRSNELDGLGVDATGHALMANLFYDFNRGGRFEPYVGVGVGYADPEDLDDPPPSIEIDSGLAYQAMVGVAIGLTERLDLDVGYRYFVADGLDWTEGGASGDLDYNHQAATIGLRYQFAAPAPPPPPPAPPPAPPPVSEPPPAPACPTSDFVVYFEWDRSNLNQAALETIDAAVARARACNVAGIVVVGHTDTSGSAQYNIGLSERRAGVVRDALVARGVDAGSINAQARGETDLARATRDGVREPLNRRTAVTISFR
jgi:OOP family OmpA-OmpF porin